MTAIAIQVIERLNKLPPNRVAVVVDFVEFLASGEHRVAAAQRPTQELARLGAPDLPAIADDEVEAKVEASHQERSAQDYQQGA